jgi:hypothetical protein
LVTISQTSIHTPPDTNRLRLLLSFLTESATRRLCCAWCRRPLAAKPAVFNLPGAEGTVGAYVNPHGFIHQTLTLRTLLQDQRLVFLEGEPEARDSWFAGYAWQIAYCSRCGHHLGWRFSLQQQQHQQEGLDRPPFFWGLRRAALVDERSVDGEQGDGDDDEEAAVAAAEVGGGLEAWMLPMQDSDSDTEEEDEEEDEEDDDDEGGSQSGTESESGDEEMEEIET